MGVSFLGGGLRGYLFTYGDRGRMRTWLESGEEDDGTRMPFVSVRRKLSRVTVTWG